MPQDCQAKLQCAACLKPFAKTEWTPSQLKNANRTTRSTALVCKACVAEGCTAYDPRYYTCKKCGKKKGCKHFDREQLRNYRDHERAKLDCLQCRQENAAIVVFFIQEIMKTCDGGIHLSHFVELYSLEADGW